jgi:hypothetical protein
MTDVVGSFMQRVLILISIVLIAGCSSMNASQKKQPVEVLESNPANVSSSYEQYMTIAEYFKIQAEVPYIARYRVKEGLPDDFKQTFASLSDLTSPAVFNYFNKQPEYVVGMQNYLNSIIRAGYVSHDTGKQLLLSALKGSINGLNTTTLPTAE